LIQTIEIILVPKKSTKLCSVENDY